MICLITVIISSSAIGLLNGSSEFAFAVKYGTFKLSPSTTRFNSLKCSTISANKNSILDLCLAASCSLTFLDFNSPNLVILSSFKVPNILHNMSLIFNQLINQTSIAPISPAKQVSVAQQPNRGNSSVTSTGRGE